MSSTILYSDAHVFNRKRIALKFSVHPIGIGELKFSDGSRVMGCDISERLGSSFTIGMLSEKLARLGYENADNASLCSPSITVLIETEDWRTSFLKDQKYGCGYVGYSNNEQIHDLQFCLSVDKEIFSAFLQTRIDLGGDMIFNMNVRGLADNQWSGPGSISATWDLDDISDCGKGNFRVITEFSLERSTNHFCDNPQTEQIKEIGSQFQKDYDKIRGMISDILAIQNGANARLLPKLFLLNLIGVTTMVVLGILLVCRLYF